MKNSSKIRSKIIDTAEIRRKNVKNGTEFFGINRFMNTSNIACCSHSGNALVGT